jgi:hypothetical protein
MTDIIILVTKVIINVRRSSRQVPVMFVQLQANFIFSTDVSQTLQYKTSRKSVQRVSSFCMWTDGYDEGNSHFSHLRESS